MKRKDIDDNTKKTSNPYMLPISIIIAGIIISVAILLSSNNTKSISTNTGNPKQNNASTNPNTSITQNGTNKVTVSLGTNPILGNVHKAKVGIVEFGDFQCPYCKEFYQNNQNFILSKYIKTGKSVFSFRDYPLTLIHPLANNLAIDSRCFGEQGKFWQFDNTIYSSSQNNDTQQIVIGIAKTLGLNISEYESCVNNNLYKNQIQKDINAGNRIGVQGTPSFVIGTLKNGKVTGQLILGTYSNSYYESIINSYL